MRRTVLLLSLAVMFGGMAGALTVDSSVNPDSTIWMSEEFNVTAECSPAQENANFDVYMDNLETQGVSYSLDEDDLDFNRSVQNPSRFSLDASHLRPYLEQTGWYSYTIRCRDNTDNEENTTVGNFTVYDLEAEFTDGNDVSDLYADGAKTIYVKVRRQPSDPVTSQVSFDVKLGHTPVGLMRAPAYRSSKESWELDLDLPDVTGRKTLEVAASHDGATEHISREVRVKAAERLNASLSSTMIDGPENVTLDVAAWDRDTRVDVTKDDLAVSLGDAKIVAAKTNSFTVQMPDLAPGTYTLDVVVDKDGFHVEDEVQVNYPVRVSGRFEGRDGDGTDYSLRFSGPTTTAPSGSGDYSARLVPGTYRLDLGFPHGEFGAEVSIAGLRMRRDWRDAVRFERYSGQAADGFLSGGLYAVRLADNITYSSTEMTLDYTTGPVDDPTAMKVFRCEDWNVAGARCYGTWNRVDATFDRTAGTVTVSASPRGAFLVGVRRPLDLRYSLDTRTYLPDQDITLTGRVKAGGDAVGDATVTGTAGGSSAEATTGANGVFDLSIPAPDTAGDHSLRLTAERGPYAPATETLDIAVERPAELRTTAPDIDVLPNASRNVSVYVENTGYRTVDIAVNASGVPYAASVTPRTLSLRVNQSAEITVGLSTPPNATEDTYTAKLGLSYADKRADAVFGITVTAPDVGNTTTESTGMLSRSAAALPALPSLGGAARSISLGGSSLGTIVLAVLLLQAAVIAVAVGRRRMRGDREHVSRAIAQIRGEAGAAAGRDEPDETPSRGGERSEGPERERVVRALSHLKQEIDGR